MRPIFCAVVLCILVQLWASVVVSRLQAVFPIYLQDFNCCMSLVTQDSFTYMAGPFLPFCILLPCQVVSCSLVDGANSHVLLHHSSLHNHLLGVAPSTLTLGEVESTRKIVPCGWSEWDGGLTPLETSGAMNFQSHRYSRKSSIPRASCLRVEKPLCTTSPFGISPTGRTNLQLIFHLNFSLPYNNRKPNTSLFAHWVLNCEHPKLQLSSVANRKVLPVW